jgi:hypothetical protein
MARVSLREPKNGRKRPVQLLSTIGMSMKVSAEQQFCAPTAPNSLVRKAGLFD